LSTVMRGGATRSPKSDWSQNARGGPDSKNTSKKGKHRIKKTNPWGEKGGGEFNTSVTGGGEPDEGVITGGNDAHLARNKGETQNPHANRDSSAWERKSRNRGRKTAPPLNHFFLAYQESRKGKKHGNMPEGKKEEAKKEKVLFGGHANP